MATPNTHPHHLLSCLLAGRTLISRWNTYPNKSNTLISLSVTGRHGHVIQFWPVSYKGAHGQVFLQRKGCIFFCMVVGERMWCLSCSSHLEFKRKQTWGQNPPCWGWKSRTVETTWMLMLWISQSWIPRLVDFLLSKKVFLMIYVIFSSVSLIISNWMNTSQLIVQGLTVNNLESYAKKCGIYFVGKREPQRNAMAQPVFWSDDSGAAWRIYWRSQAL